MQDLKLQVSVTEQRRLEEFLVALRANCIATVDKTSDITNSAFASEFQSRLLTQHCFIGSPLFQQGFDTAFIESCKTAGHQVSEAPEGQRFWDVEVNGRKISLKTTKAANLRPMKLHISKLTEAAWIQDCRTAAHREQETKDLFREYCRAVDSILQFRYFKKTNLYELVEIQGSLLKQVLTVGREHFNADGPTINIPVGSDPPDFTLKIDRSDSKITLANINKERCSVLGTWQL